MSDDPELNANPIKILLCANNDYAQHLAVTLASIVINNANDHLEITIAGNIKEATQRKLHEVLSLNRKSSLTFITLDTIHEACLDHLSAHDLPTQGDYNIKGSYSIDVYTRLLLDHIFSPETERVLYLDSDLVVDGSLRPLWDTDILDYPVAGVPVPYYDRTHLPNLTPGDRYVNSGVLLFNLPAWRSLGCEIKCISFIKNNQAILRDPDQDALNAALKGHIFFLSAKWNAFGAYLKALDNEKPNAPSEPPVVYHFNGANKPWLYLSDPPMKHLYSYYLQRTPWRGSTPPDKTPTNIAWKWARRLTPSVCKRAARRLLFRPSL